MQKTRARSHAAESPDDETAALPRSEAPKARTRFKAFSLAPNEYRSAARCGTNMKYV